MNYWESALDIGIEVQLFQNNPNLTEGFVTRAIVRLQCVQQPNLNCNVVNGLFDGTR